MPHSGTWLAPAIAAGVALSPLAAHAEVVTEASVEWRTVDAELVAYGWVTSVRPNDEGADVSFEAREVLAGPARRSVRVRWPGVPPFRAGDEIVLFLVGQAGGFIPRTPDDPRRSYYDLDELASAPAVTHDMRVLATREEVFEAVASRAARGVPTLRESRSPVGATSRAEGAVVLDVVPGTGAHALLYADSAVTLVVPADQAEEGRRTAEARVQTARELAEARAALSRSALGAAVLAALLLFVGLPMLARSRG